MILEFEVIYKSGSFATFSVILVAFETFVMFGMGRWYE